MSYERDLSPVAPIMFTANGGTEGQITLATTLGLFVKQNVQLKATGITPLTVEIKRVLSDTQILVGPKGHITARTDVSAFTTILGANLSAQEQPKAKIDMETRLYGSYIQEPSNSWRVTPVDSFGNSIDSTNPLPVSFDGTVQIGNVSIVEGGNTVKVNPDGSINVIVESQPSTNSQVVSVYNQITAVASGLTTQLLTYTVPEGFQAVLQKCPVSGDNIGKYDLLINGTIQDTIRTNFGGNLTERFDWTTGNDSGYVLNAGDVVTVQVLNSRPNTGTYEGRLQVLQINLS